MVPPRCSALAALAVGVAVVASAGGMWRRPSARVCEDPVDALALEAAERAYEGLAPEEGPFTFRVIATGRSSRRDLHVVECYDRLGRYEGACTWNEPAHLLWGLSWVRHSRPDAAHGLAGRTAAASAAWHWLVTAGVVGRASPWRMEGRPFRDGGVWYVHFRGNSERVLACVDATTAKLRWARVFPIRPMTGR